MRKLYLAACSPVLDQQMHQTAFSYCSTSKYDSPQQSGTMPCDSTMPYDSTCDSNAHHHTVSGIGRTSSMSDDVSTVFTEGGTMAASSCSTNQTDGACTSGLAMNAGRCSLQLPSVNSMYVCAATRLRVVLGRFEPYNKAPVGLLLQPLPGPADTWDYVNMGFKQQPCCRQVRALLPSLSLSTACRTCCALP